MRKIKEQKEKFYFYWEQRKYKLSFFGFNPNFDWLVFLFIASGMLIGSGIFGSLNYQKINSELNREIILEVKEKKQINFEEINNFVSSFQARNHKFSTLMGEDSLLSEKGETKINLSQ